MYRSSIVRILILMFVLTGVLVHPVDSSTTTRNKGFSPSVTETEYTNKTIHFQVADPYDGYDVWTYSYLGGSQGASDNRYHISTDTDGYTQYFGYDEFSSQSDIMAELWFRPIYMTGAYRFEPIAYFYQKTDLHLGTNLAVAVFWYESNLYLYHNTAQGESVSGELLASVSPQQDYEYRITLANSGNDTWVRVYDIVYDTVVYNGTTTTFNYDATTLYAGFGQYSAGSGNIWTRWDNFTIVDSTLIYETIDPIYLWGLDVGLILMGLIMIPASTMYFVRGGKDDMSRDKLFYFLFAFVMGWALVIGGIMP